MSRFLSVLVSGLLNCILLLWVQTRDLARQESATLMYIINPLICFGYAPRVFNMIKRSFSCIK